MLKSTREVLAADSHPTGTDSVRALFDREESNLLRYAFALTGRRAVAEEIVQDVFLQLHATWDEVESPGAWLFRSVRNRAFNHLRKCKRENLQRDDDLEQAPQPSDQASPAALLARMETAAELRMLLEKLGELDRQLVHLKYFEGLKYREISQRTGLSIGNVGYRLHQILKRLADSLEPLEFDC